METMTEYYKDSTPCGIWIVGRLKAPRGCRLEFPVDDKQYTNIIFSDNDKHEPYLSHFDTTGIKVFLQVEPGNASVDTLIDLVLNKYKHHPCVIGFGVDVEWYKTNEANDYEGEAVSDAEAEAWSSKIKTYNENYLLFTKHWLVSKMPPTFRDDIVFVDDSQIFPNMGSMVNEFQQWSKAFAPAKVAFQYGYTSDKNWWANLTDPPKNIGDEILKTCPNTSDLFWVDFTAYDIWPEDFNPLAISDNVKDIAPTNFNLLQNYHKLINKNFI